MVRMRSWANLTVRHYLSCNGSWTSSEDGWNACDACGVWRVPHWVVKLRNGITPSRVDDIPVDVGMALDLWMAFGLDDRDFHGYVGRNGVADTWAVLVHHARVVSGTYIECPYPGCLLMRDHNGPCYEAGDVGTSEPLPFG